MTTCTFSRLFIVVLSVAAALLAVETRAGTVGEGTPESCTEGALSTQLEAGGTITFSCGGGPVTIPITTTMLLKPTSGGIGGNVLTIDGTGQQITLDGQNLVGIFVTEYNESTFTVNLKRLTLRRGRAAEFGGAIRLVYQEPNRLTTLNAEYVTFDSNEAVAAGNDVGGGAIYALGGILNIEHCTFTGNQGGNGGAIGNLQARFTIEDSTFSGNSTHARSGGNGGNGGAIYVDGSNNGLLTIRRSVFVNNVSTNLGGAIHTYQYARSSGVAIEDSTFQGNATQWNGGAIYHQNGTLRIERSTFAGNTTVGQGGALWLLETSAGVITNSTFTGNSATGRSTDGSTGLGGAILINDENHLTLSHLTIVNNSADWVGGGICGGSTSDTTLRASIVANNSAANGGHTWNIGKNCSSQLGNGGFNLQYPARNASDGNDRDCSAGIEVAEPKLGPLADNGGLTQTRALLGGSPAWNKVTTGCPPPTTDQRGVSRQSLACDIGAYEGGIGLTVADVTVSEGAGSATFTITASAAPPSAIAVHWSTAPGTAAAGADYVTASGTATIPAGATSTTLGVTIVADTLDESNETFFVNLDSATNAGILDGQAVGTIQDDDPAPALSASDCTATEGHTGSRPCTFTVSLSAASGRTVSVAYTTANATASAGSDYSSVSGTLTLAAGTTSQTVAVPVLGDTQDELDETFTLNLSGAQNATIADAQGVGTVDDDDGPLVSVGSASVAEGNAGTVAASFTVSLSASSVQNVVVAYATANGTATSGGDYAVTSGSLTFSPGTTSLPVTVAVNGDTTPEPDETFYLAVTSVQEGDVSQGAGLGWILDDDGASVAMLEVSHGDLRWADLGSAAGVATPDLYLLHLPPRTSWELTVDAASGDVAAEGTHQGPLLRRLANDLVTQLGPPSVASGRGPARSLRLRNTSAVPQDAYVQVASAGCSTNCGADDVYRLRVRETTGFVPRFNTAGTQTTVLMLQNRTAATIEATAYFWSPAGRLLASQALSLAPHALVVTNLSGAPALAGQSGSISIEHGAGSGELAGKAVALEPSTGFSFDTPLTYRP